MSNITVYRENGDAYSNVGYIGWLELRLAIIEGRVNESLYIERDNIHYPIDEYGICDIDPYKVVDELLSKIVKSQMYKRIYN